GRGRASAGSWPAARCWSSVAQYTVMLICDPPSARWSSAAAGRALVASGGGEGERRPARLAVREVECVHQVGQGAGRHQRAVDGEDRQGAAAGEVPDECARDRDLLAAADGEVVVFDRDVRAHAL